MIKLGDTLRRLYGAPPAINRFDPNQPRDRSGKWSATGAGGGGSHRERQERYSRDKQQAARTIERIRGGGSFNEESMARFADLLSGLRVKDLKELKREYGLKASGRKAQLVERLAARLTDRADLRLRELQSGALTRGRLGDGESVVEGDAAGDERGGRSAGGAAAGAGGRVARAAEGSAGGAGREGGPAAGGPAGPLLTGRVPAELGEVNSRIDRYAQFFRAKGQHEAAGWMDQLKGHVNAVGTEEALHSLGEEVAGRGTDPEGVRYAGWADMGDFAKGYLDRHGITLVHENAPAPGGKRIIATVAPSSDESGTRSRGDARDVFPRLQTLRDKLHESQNLPGLEASEDMSALLGGEMGKKVERFTPEVVAKLDEKYGKDKWIVKSYGDDAYAGYGIFFPQRVRQIQQDAQSTLWSAGENLARYGFDLRRDDKGYVVGLEHRSGDRYDFGTERYANTIHGDARHWGDRAAAAAPNEKGAAFPEGRFMAQPAFPVVGITDEERAQGITFKKGQEGRVHIVTKDGKASIVPHATWLKQEHLPVVFENDDTRAMAQAALKAINALPSSERRGQLYAPDVVKTAKGYEVVEANPANEAGASGYLQDNPMVIDAYVSHLTGRDPAHVRFIRQLLSRRRKAKKTATETTANARLRQTLNRLYAKPQGTLSWTLLSSGRARTRSPAGT